MPETFNCIIMGAAGRDFHDLQTFFRGNPGFRVCALTAAQIPFIESRTFPKELAGPEYDDDIPIHPENDLPGLIERLDVDFVFLAYSDLAHVDVMHKASLVQSCGAGFALLGPRQTQLQSAKPVIAVTGVRTGVGKSPLTQWIARYVTAAGYRVAVVRHPMPYGNLMRQRVERFDIADDLDRFDCTIEEREEYAPYLEQNSLVFAGVDYEQILRQAEAEADLILWDGGNNDYSFIRPDFSIVVADALRPGHELAFYPGETNFRAADVLVINKAGQAEAEAVHTIRENARAVNPDAEIVESILSITVDDPQAISGRKVLVVEDGPTLTHGGMAYGAGLLAARKYGAASIVDPRATAVGTVAETLRKYPHVENVLPALGYSSRQREELAETIDASGADVVIDASPAGLGHVVQLQPPVVPVHDRFEQKSGPAMEELIGRLLKSAATS